MVTKDTPCARRDEVCHGPLSPHLAQVASEGGFGHLRLNTSRRFETLRGPRDALWKGRAIPGVKVPTPGGQFYAVCELPIDNADAFCQWMLEHFDLDGDTVMMAPATGFYATPGAGTKQVRTLRLGLESERAQGGVPRRGLQTTRAARSTSRLNPEA